MNIMKEIKYCWFCIRHPAAGFDGVKWSGRGSVKLAIAIVAALFLVTVLRAQLTGFAFNTTNPDKFSVLSIFAITAGGFLLVFISGCAVSSLLPSEAFPSQILINMAYSLVPYILGSVVYVIASNLVSLQMEAFMRFIDLICIGWVCVVLLMGMFQIHQTSFGLVLANVALTAFGVVVMVFFMLLLYSLYQQLYSFFFTIFSEIMFRF